jgi:hypothetical protein
MPLSDVQSLGPEDEGITGHAFALAGASRKHKAEIRFSRVTGDKKAARCALEDKSQGLLWSLHGERDMARMMAASKESLAGDDRLDEYRPTRDQGRGRGLDATSILPFH